MITVVTSTVETRAVQLAELAASIANQSIPPTEWLIHWDVERRGVAACINALVERANTEWVFPMGDDDLFMPHHFDTLTMHLSADADVVWTLPSVPGRRELEAVVSRQFNPDVMDDHNQICAPAAVRRSLWLELGGYRDVPTEDWDLWRRALAAGARFRQVMVQTWVYRCDDSWPHRSNGPI